MKHILFFYFLFITTLPAYNQEKDAHVLFDKKGKKVTYEKMFEELAKKDIILFGELHNNPISHWLQLELTKDLYNRVKIELGAEMFETDNQEVLDKYLQGEIDEKALDSLARLWKNYKTDYAPLVNFAKTNKLSFTATNIPRKYASMVHKKGFEALDTLSTAEKSLMAPLPILFDPELPSYKNILTMMGDHGTLDLVKAQAIKDATMAHFIMKNFEYGTLFIHFNGAYHSDQYEGILWYLKKSNDKLNYGTISTVSQADVQRLEKENFGKADFIICVDEDMTETY